MKKLFIPCHSKKDPLPALKKAAELLADKKRISVLSTAQHMDRLEGMVSFLEAAGFSVVSSGQVLGCNQEVAESSGDVDAFLYVGSGVFHPSGLFYKTEKPVVLASPYSGSARYVTDEERAALLKKQKARITRAYDAKTFGILVSSKTGQMRLEEALRIKEKIESKGKKAYLFAGEEIRPDRLMGLRIDAWVNTACPRIAEDVFEKPVLNPGELEVIL